jgi:hypothetical protein
MGKHWDNPPGRLLVFVFPFQFLFLFQFLFPFLFLVPGSIITDRESPLSSKRQRRDKPGSPSPACRPL